MSTHGIDTMDKNKKLFAVQSRLSYHFAISDTTLATGTKAYLGISRLNYTKPNWFDYKIISEKRRTSLHIVCNQRGAIVYE